MQSQVSILSLSASERGEVELALASAIREWAEAASEGVIDATTGALPQHLALLDACSSVERAAQLSGVLRRLVLTERHLQSGAGRDQPTTGDALASLFEAVR